MPFRPVDVAPLRGLGWTGRGLRRPANNCETTRGSISPSDPDSSGDDGSWINSGGLSAGAMTMPADALRRWARGHAAAVRWL